MKACRLILLTIWCVFSMVSTSTAETILYDWGFDVNGTKNWATPGNATDITALPNAFNSSAFDWNTGLGTITLKFDPNAAGSYKVLSYFDHEIGESVNTAYNEYGSVHGAPAPNQTFQMETPPDVIKYLQLNHYNNTNEFDGQHVVMDNDQSQGLTNDISMGIGWEGFLLTADQHAVITFTLRDTSPTGFYLAQHDSLALDPGTFGDQYPGTAQKVYFSSSIAIVTESTPNPTPEPATLTLLALGLGGIAVRRKTGKQ